MNSNEFWNMLSKDSKEKAEKILKSYSGSDGVIGRIFEIYEESATLANCTTEEYLKDVDPNEYVDYHYEMYLETQV